MKNKLENGERLQLHKIAWTKKSILLISLPMLVFNHRKNFETFIARRTTENHGIYNRHWKPYDSFRFVDRSSVSSRTQRKPRGFWKAVWGRRNAFSTVFRLLWWRIARRMEKLSGSRHWNHLDYMVWSFSRKYVRQRMFAIGRKVLAISKEAGIHPDTGLTSRKANQAIIQTQTTDSFEFLYIF